MDYRSAVHLLQAPILRAVHCRSAHHLFWGALLLKEQCTAVLSIFAVAAGGALTAGVHRCDKWYVPYIIK